MKIRLRAIKWTTWLLIAVATGGAWVFYFADAPTLAHQLLTFSAPPVAYISIAVLTATTFVFGGFMREQICIYACPWPRIQGAMMDESTMTVAYRDWRGEPRGKHRKAAGAEALGDCIDCNACVNVCPMGIDIRDGQQLACITCALCIDACDDVMGKIGKPRGLIDYLTLADGERERTGTAPVPAWRGIVRPRTLLYFVLWSLIGVGLLVALFMRGDLAFSIEPVRNPVNVILSDGSVRNAYELRLRNMTGDDRDFRLSVASDAPVVLTLEGIESLDVTVPADATFRQRVYLTAAPGSPAAATPQTGLDLVVEDTANGARVTEGTVFHGRQD
jgi:cytochrome c oxidase accessory protein FixG